MKRNSKILVALGAGIAIGGLLGVLFAPRKGSETRKKISDAGNDLADKVRDEIKKGKEKFAAVRNEAEEIIGRTN